MMGHLQRQSQWDVLWEEHSSRPGSYYKGPGARTGLVCLRTGRKGAGGKQGDKDRGQVLGLNRAWRPAQGGWIVF